MDTTDPKTSILINCKLEKVILHMTNLSKLLKANESEGQKSDMRLLFM